MKKQVTSIVLFWLLIITIILIFAFSCSKVEDTFCWNCSMIQRYINDENKIVTWYKDSFTICDRTQFEIYLFEFQNTHWVDSTRYIGSTIECQKQ
jgi:hypothetical protein